MPDLLFLEVFAPASPDFTDPFFLDFVVVIMEGLEVGSLVAVEVG